MKTSTLVLILAIVLPSLAILAFYFIAKYYQCKPDCTKKQCGQSDGCNGTCKLCPNGLTCDGTKCKTPPGPGPTTKGICYFDIDNTLTSAQGDRDEMMRQCLDNNFAIGIITASNRKLEDVCDGDKPREPWMSELLCKQFNKNGARMYNSTSVVAGSTVFPANYPFGKDQGYIKGYDMKYGRDTFYKDIPDKCIVLFDDQQPVLDGVHNFDPNFQTQCANTPHSSSDKTTCKTLGHVLDIATVKAKVESMKANGCI
jgi:hypothetical protein